MAYCTVDGLTDVLPEAELIRLTDDAGAGLVDAGKAAWAVDAAAAVMDAYLQEVVDLPLTGDVPPLLTKINQDLAVGNLYARAAAEVPAVWKERCLAAAGLLGDIAEGRRGLFPRPAGPAAGPDRVQTSSRDKVFGPDKLSGF